MENKCFVCNTIRNVDGHDYNQGGLKRCCRSDTAAKILKKKDSILQLNDHPLYPAARRLQVILAGFHDIFAADVFIHQSCYKNPMMWLPVRTLMFSCC